MVESQIGLSVGNILTVIGGFGIVFGAFYKLLCKKFDGIDKKFEALESKFDKKFDKMDGDIKEVRSEMKELRETVISFEKNTEHRFGKIETRLSVLPKLRISVAYPLLSRSINLL